MIYLRWAYKRYLLISIIFISIWLYFFASHLRPLEKMNINIPNLKKYLSSHILSCDSSPYSCYKNATTSVIIMSAVKNFEARRALRSLWQNSSDTRVLFYCGYIHDTEILRELQKEREKYSDVIIDLQFFDSYGNLTLKTVSMLHWFSECCPTSKYILKADDDVFVNVKNFLQFISCLELYNKNDVYLNDMCKIWDFDNIIGHFIHPNFGQLQSYIFGGYLYKSVYPDRNYKSKWYISEKTYPYLHFPPFLSGTAYLLSSNIISSVLDRASELVPIHLEDVFLTGIVASQSLNIHLSNLNGWNCFRPYFDSLCTYNDVITAHGLTPYEIEAFSSNLEKLKKDDCAYIYKFFSYINGILTYYFPRVN